MDVDEALAVMWQAVAGSSQAIIADQIEVSPSTLTLWKSGTVPTGKSRQKLIAWAKKVTSVPDVLAVAAERTGQNLVRLSTISGYAQAVLDMMRSVTEQQAQVVESLAPWVDHEADARDIEIAKQTAAAALQKSHSSRKSSHPGTGAADRRTGALQDDTADVAASRRPE